ncbi:MAG: polysaccharide deacetylase family protein [Caulobacteraceae bacterium]|nr:polysaccharide deacetylase family protein [Caulobacteraceae bacterium]
MFVGREIASALGPIERALAPHAPVILIYHRVVADSAEDIWGIAVGRDRFAEQIEALTRVRRVLPLGELAAAAAQGRRYDRPLAAVTFDDGYHDVFTAARPILERFDCPATVFVVTGLVDAPREFWWDELEFIFLETPRLPAELRTTFGRETVEWRFPEGVQSARTGPCHYLRRYFLGQPSEKVEAHLAALRDWAGLSRPARAKHRAMGSGELAQLNDGLIAVGAHTVTHPALPVLPPERQAQEIAASRKACEALTGRPVPHFAYPFGRYDRASRSACREAGFAQACATIPGPVRRWSDPFLLPRIAPGQADGEALARRLS